MEPSDILIFMTVIAELLLVPSLPLGHRAWNKHRSGQQLVFDDDGTDMKGRNLSLACVSPLTSPHLALSAH